MPLPLKLNDTHRRVLGAIRRHQPVPRASLSKIAGLGSGPVTQITRDLLLSGLIKEGERIRGGRGQPALPLMLDPAGALSFGVSMIPGGLRVVAIDFAGRVVDEAVASASDNGPDTTAAIVAMQIDQICKRVRVHDRDRILGVGFALPGFFFQDHDHMRVVDEHASWRSARLVDVFATALGFPCWIENDGTATAMAEYYEQAEGAQTIVTLLINYGIGAGLVLDGQPFRGGHGNAGEIGAFFPLDRPRPSGSDLLQALAAAGIYLGALDQIDLSDARQTSICSEWARRAGDQLGRLVDSAWSWFDPKMIVLSGPLPPELLNEIVDSIDADRLFSQHPDRPKPTLRASSIGSSVAAIGAAHIPLHSYAG